MRYTLGQAVRRLQASSHAYGVTDVREAVNRAIESLAGMSSWECLRHLVRFISAGPCLTLPQGTAGLVRACVNGRPASLRGQDFRFLHSGPGDLNTVPTGFSRVSATNVVDLGEVPVIVEPMAPFRIFACSDGTAGAPSVTVTGMTVEGKLLTIVLPVVSAPVYSGSTLISGQKPDDVTADTNVFQTIVSVTLDEATSEYVTLYAEDTDTLDRFPIAVYHPSVVSPKFRKYMIAGIPPDRPVEILAEIRIDPLPLVRDTDPLPFDGIDPVEWMIRSDWCMKSNEIDTAQKYQAQAAQWLKSKEIVNDTVQTSIVINSVYDNSLGEISKDAFNV